MKDEQGEFCGWDVVVRRRHDVGGHHVSFNYGMQQRQGAAGTPQPISQMAAIDVLAEGEGFKAVWHAIEERHLRGISRDVYEKRAISAVRCMIAAGA